MTVRSTRYTIVLSILIITLLAFKPLRAESVTLFAAASLTSVVSEAARTFEARTGTKIRASFASSSSLARQIEAGAEADLYLSANVKWMDYLETRGLIDPERQFRRISNSLVLISPQHLDLPPIPTLSSDAFETALGENGLLTMGDPDHVPAGLYAKNALTKLGLWEGIRNRIARADHARAALALVERGETPLGIVYQTDAALVRSVKILHKFKSASHEIRYALARTRTDKRIGCQRILRLPHWG